MTAPKHLWSGDWRADSAAARERAGSRTEPRWPQEPPAPPPPEPSLLARALAAMRRMKRSLAAAAAGLLAALRRLRPPGAPRRGAVVALAAVALIAAGAYGLSTLLDSNGSSPTSASRNLAYLGVQMESVPINRVLVAGVVPGSPADRAGIGPGDVIAAIDNGPVMQPGDVTGRVSNMHPGDSIVLQIERGGVPYTTKVTLASQPGAAP